MFTAGTRAPSKITWPESAVNSAGSAAVSIAAVVSRGGRPDLAGRWLAEVDSPTLLIVGCGDVGLRAAKALLPRCRVLALTSSSSRVTALRAQGIVPLLGNLDAPATAERIMMAAADVKRRAAAKI